MIHVNKITLNINELLLEIGDQYSDLNATVYPSNATKPCVTWTSSNVEVAAVHRETGHILTTGVGTAIIYACACDSSKVYACCNVTVTPIRVKKLIISHTGHSIFVGESKPLTATVVPENAADTSLTWTTSDPSVAVYANGRVYAKGEGRATITVSTNDGSCLTRYCNISAKEKIYVESISISSTDNTIAVGFSTYLNARVLPDNASCCCVEWKSNNPSVATVNPESGLVIGRNVGNAVITAKACDGSGVTASYTINVTPVVCVSSVSLETVNADMAVGEVITLNPVILPVNATVKTVKWTSDDSSIASVHPFIGRIVAKNPGITTIRVTTEDGGYQAECEVWVKGKTPVFLIHGRTSNSKDVWGINNNIPSDQNNDYNSDINALSLNGKKYTDVDSQALGSFVPNNGDGDTDYPCNLGNKLLDSGYQKNINLFAFNYPNEDAVKYSAQKFETYINNLISHVRTSGSNDIKTCFYASRNDYNNNNYKINIVGHSMGGLVARYYIENLYHDYSVSKLVTICTPHWGSGYAYLSNTTGAKHVLCDHDLDFDSAMFGGSNSTTVNCDKGTCPESNYIVTSALQYQRQRSTKYYAIAGIDYDAAYVNLDDHTFEMPTNFTTYQEISDYLVSKNVYKLTGKDMQIIYKPDPKNIGDNMVGFMSQIGWTEDNSSTPNKKISMEKIFVDVDTNGGNGGETFVWEAIMEWLFGDALLHSKIPHRTRVVEKTVEFLGE